MGRVNRWEDCRQQYFEAASEIDICISTSRAELFTKGRHHQDIKGLGKREKRKAEKVQHRYRIAFRCIDALGTRIQTISRNILIAQENIQNSPTLVD